MVLLRAVGDLHNLHLIYDSAAASNMRARACLTTITQYLVMQLLYGTETVHDLHSRFRINSSIKDFVLIVYYNLTRALCFSAVYSSHMYNVQYCIKGQYNKFARISSQSWSTLNSKSQSVQA